MSKNDMKNRIYTLSKNDLKDLVKTYRIPLDLHPRLPDPRFTMDHLSDGAIGIYSEFLWFSGGIQDVCMDDSPSSLKKWKDKFLLIDHRAILDYLKWRHSCSCVSDDLLTDDYDRNDVERLCARLICLREIREEVIVRSGLSSVWFNKECDSVFRRIYDNAEMSIYDFMTLPSWGDAKVPEESHHLSSPLLERVPSHTTTSAAEGAMIPLPTLDEIAASMPDPRLAKKSKGPSQVSVRSSSDTVLEPGRPSKKRKLRKRSSEAGSSTLELGQAEGVDEADLTDFCAEIENSLERDEGTYIRATSVPTPRLGKRLGAPPSVVVVSASGSSLVGTSVHASTSGHSLSLGGMVAEVVWRQMDPLDSLAHSALARDAEYDQILKDNFGTTTREEWNGRHAPEDNILCKDIFKDSDVCRKALHWTITPTKLKRTESLLPLDLSNCFNVLSALLVSYGAELNSRCTGLVTARNRLQEKFDRKVGYVKVLRSTTLDGKLERMHKDCDALIQEKRLRSQKDVASDKVKELQTELTDVRVASIGLSEELSQTDAKLSDQTLVVRDLQNELVLEKAKSQGYKDDVDGLREEVTRFVGFGVESLVRKLLSSDEFYAALAHVASLDINYGVKRGLRMRRTDAEFEAVAQKADFDKALVDFPTTPFPFLGKIVAASGGTLFEVTQVLLDKHIRSVTSASVAPPIAHEDADQVPLEHASDDLATNATKLFIEELLWEGEDFVLPPFYWRICVLLSFAPVNAYYFIRRLLDHSSCWDAYSAGITASVPYARLNGVSPLLVVYVA
ncbi:hypothetical protein Tco_1316915 [Tanacetum coccineum]